jgi:hypothetical protein
MAGSRASPGHPSAAPAAGIRQVGKIARITVAGSAREWGQALSSKLPPVGGRPAHESLCALRPHSAGSTLPHLWPTGSSSGWPPSTTARYFSLRIPPHGGHPALRSSRCGGFRSALAVSSFRLRARLGFSIPASPPGQRGITPAFWIRRPSSERRRDLNPPDHHAAQRTQ